ncbi:DUF4932 domain-containing protein [Epilithonimonas sp. UC225_85]|uniref:DUF4932 domain-containing protein n=1 Tax=Epilithonimonas sp. UC225_85 TaxID=3350167 RepID=UPI0036D3C68E
MKKTLALFTLAVFTNSCSVSCQNLKTNQSHDSWKADFVTFTGKEKIDFDSEKNKLVYLSSELQNSEGKLYLLKDGKELPNQNKINHTKIDLQNPSQIQIIGKKAKGSFELKYPIFDVKTIKVVSNQNFELLALSYLLLNLEDFENIPDTQTFKSEDGKETRVKDLYALNLKIGQEFKSYQKSKNLEIIKTYFDRNFYLHFSNFVMGLDNFPNAKVISDKQFSHEFSSLSDQEKFVKTFNNFYKEVHFDEFLKKYQPYYQEMISEVSNHTPKENFIIEMEHFYSKKVDNYVLYPSLMMPFSQGFAVGNSDTIGNVFASFNKPENVNDTSGFDLGFKNDVSLRTICIHEFGHSFVNPAVDKIDEQLMDSKEFLFEPIKNKMSEQAYNQWKICLYEHFDRAGEVIIAKLIGDSKKADEILNDNVKNRSFIYLPQIINQLEYWYYNEFFSKTYEQKVSEIVANLQTVSN